MLKYPFTFSLLLATLCSCAYGNGNLIFNYAGSPTYDVNFSTITAALSNAADQPDTIKPKINLYLASPPSGSGDTTIHFATAVTGGTCDPLSQPSVGSNPYSVCTVNTNQDGGTAARNNIVFTITLIPCDGSIAVTYPLSGHEKNPANVPWLIPNSKLSASACGIGGAGHKGEIMFSRLSIPVITNPEYEPRSGFYSIPYSITATEGSNSAMVSGVVTNTVDGALILPSTTPHEVLLPTVYENAGQPNLQAEHFAIENYGIESTFPNNMGNLKIYGVPSNIQDGKPAIVSGANKVSYEVYYKPCSSAAIKLPVGDPGSTNLPNNEATGCGALQFYTPDKGSGFGPNYGSTLPAFGTYSGTYHFIIAHP
jgi:hypothetical protein